MRVIYVSRCRVCPYLVNMSCGVRCYYSPPVSSILGEELDSIAPNCPLAEAPTSEEMGNPPQQSASPCNSQITPCSTCGGSGMSVVWNFCPECGRRL